MTRKTTMTSSCKSYPASLHAELRSDCPDGKKFAVIEGLREALKARAASIAGRRTRNVQRWRRAWVRASNGPYLVLRSKRPAERWQKFAATSKRGRADQASVGA